jgi:hypothetical protein
MATPTMAVAGNGSIIETGGHSFWVAFTDTTITPYSRTINFKGCNVAGCHTTMSTAYGSYVTRTKKGIGYLDTIADHFKRVAGADIFNKVPWYSKNIWSTVTDRGYDGTLNIYDPSSNVTGYFRNPAPAGSWTAGQVTTNNSKPKFPSLLNVQEGAIINFQLWIAEFSQGIHNPMYSDAVLANTIQQLTAAGK